MYSAPQLALSALAWILSPEPIHAPLAQDPAPPSAGTGDELEDLRRRVEELELGRSAGSQGVDLEASELPSIEGAVAGDVAARPWYERIQIWGFGAFGFLDTGDAGAMPEGTFLVKEATLFVEAEAWENVAFFAEIQTNHLGEDDEVPVRTGEVYAHVRDLLRGDDGSYVGLKLGRVDVPFGDEYLSQDSIDNPLISLSAPYVYGFDEGLLLYGKLSGVGWIASITDGTEARSLDDDSSKALNAKLYGSVAPWLDLSASAMAAGDSEESALEFGGSHIQPVGAEHVSTLGASPSEKVSAGLYELDAHLHAGAKAHLDLAFGHAAIDDDVDSFDRDLTWFRVEPRYDLTPELYLALRWSEIGTFDGDEGFHFDGKIIADGNDSVGYDAQSLRRISGGVGWRPNPHTTFKVEVGEDRFELIDASPLDPGDGDRLFLGFEVAVSF